MQTLTHAQMWQLCLGKRLLLQSRQRVSAPDAFGATEAVMLCQDGMELIFMVAAQAANVELTKKQQDAGFYQLWTALHQKKKELVKHKIVVGKLNNMRVQAKHYGMRPHDNEAKAAVWSAINATNDILEHTTGRELRNVSQAEFLENRLVARRLTEAETVADTWAELDDASRQRFIDLVSEAYALTLQHRADLDRYVSPDSAISFSESKEAIRAVKDAGAKNALKKLRATVEELMKYTSLVNDRVGELEWGMNDADQANLSKYLRGIRITAGGGFFSSRSASSLPATEEGQLEAQSILDGVIIRAAALDRKSRPLIGQRRKLSRAVEATWGKQRELAANLSSGVIVQLERESDSVGYIKLFGVDVEVPADALSPV